MENIKELESIVWYDIDPVSENFDGYEVWPLKNVASEVPDWNDSEPFWEQCEPEEAEVWGVFGHINTGGIDSICDCKNESTALIIEAGLNIQLENKLKTI